LETDLSFEKLSINIRKILWTNIIDSINDIWSSIQIIFAQIDLLKLPLEEIEKTREEMGRKPEEAIKLINFMNSRSRQ